MEPDHPATTDGADWETRADSSQCQSRWSVLDGLEQTVRERYQQQHEKVKALETQQEAERAHSRYLRNTSQTSSQEQLQARLTAESWRKKHEISKRAPALPAVVRRIPVAAPVASCVSPGTASKKVATPNRRTGPFPCNTSTVGCSSTFPTVVDEKLCQCPVLNCEMKLTGETLLEYHLAKGCHTPCHPCRHLLDGRLERTGSPAYMCPVCRVTFQSAEACLDHMVTKGHERLMTPLAVAAYACPECLILYPELEACRQHMKRAHHHRYLYPYSDDGSCAHVPEPVSVPEGMLSAYIQQCQQTPWQVQCLDCGTNSIDKEAVAQHLENKHVVVASSDFTPAEAFALLIRPYTCVQCLRLFADLPEGGLCSPHQCDEDVLGLIINNDCRTFQEYVCRFSLGVDAKHVMVDWTDDSSRVDGGQKEQNMGEVSTCQAFGDDRVQLQDPEGEEMEERTPLAEWIRRFSCAIKRKSPNEDSENGDDDNDGGSAMARKKCKLSPQEGPPGLFGISSAVKEMASNSGSIVALPSGSSKGMSFARPPKTTAHCQRRPELASVQGIGKTRREMSPLTSSNNTSPRAVFPSLQNLSLGSPTRPDSCQASSLDRAGELPLMLFTPSPCWQTPKQNTTRHSLNRVSQSKGGNDTKAGASLEKLSLMKQIIFLDLDNWANFFRKLPNPLPDGTFVWAFHGGGTVWKEPWECSAFQACSNANCFYMQPRSGQTKNAADFALCLMVGRMDALLSKNIPFTILSGDKGFLELQRQMEDTERRTVVIDPHHKTVEEVYILIQSVADV